MAISPPPVSTMAPQLDLPARVARLGDLAYNLWWSWHEPARALFRGLNPILWEACDQNPVPFLRRVGRPRLEEAAVDPAFLAAYDDVLGAFDAMLNARETWVTRHEPLLAAKTLAYFSAEFGLHRALPIYSGGLGVLAGDHMKEASDLGLPVVGVSLLYRQGYLRQRLDASGWQQDVTSDFGHDDEPVTRAQGPDGEPLLVEVPMDGLPAPLRLAVWQVMVGRVPIYLMDADIDGNPDWARTISGRLYGGDKEHRLRQEIVLGIGGVRALRALGIAPDYWHANEGHAAFHLLERVREHVAGGSTFDQAAARVRATTIFTSHTPVPAGHDVFSPEQMDRYFGGFWGGLGLDRGAFLALGQHAESHDGFNLTALSLRLAGHRNAVSERHGEITRDMWHEIWPGVSPAVVPITSITNGVHLSTWTSPRITSLLDEHLAAGWRERIDDTLTWEPVRQIPEVDFWKAHQRAKQDLIDLLDERARQRWAAGGFDPSQVVTAGPFLDRKALLVGFARRFATYKRATLLFTDIDRLAAILNHPEYPVQIVFAGKAHPADDGGKRMIQEIAHRARDPRLGGRVAFAEDYDMGLAGALVSGVDVWLNNPRAPLEASGTSGMKAAANGVPNLSILDGWWSEGWHPDNSNGWGIEPAPLSGEEQDRAEADAIYHLLETAVVPLYYARDADGVPQAWCRLAREAIRTVSPAFSARRMVVEYIHRLYHPAAGAS
ncbi:MAG: Glycogen phosphorylase [uncultured Thermomicrobiales bacterium]|uniref:Glycogen phosphorylase n=1 Tax=uncultured Thermomicrobiales bacterium TaxID=1645740 RepID=A0A6J4UNC8_9BACT|nr:MAG: Glycogen phosphorylase [uncultured Thermomicrobiales bacterium]